MTDQAEIAALVDRLAELRDLIEPTLPDLRAAKNETANKLASAQKLLDDAEMVLRETALQYVRETGDLNPHPSLTFRKTTKLVYDKDEIKEALVSDAMGSDVKLSKDDILELFKEGRWSKYIKLNVELDVRAVETAFKDGTLDWLQIEEVASPTIAISRLGEIIIRKEMDEKEKMTE